MRKAFGGKGSGGGGGGGSMLRAVGRAVGASLGGVQEALSATSSVARPSRVLSLSSSSSSTSLSSPTRSNVSVSGISRTRGWGSSSRVIEGGIEDWEAVEGEEEEESVGGYYERFVFGQVPMREEVEDAVSSLREIFVPVSFSQAVEDGFFSPLDDDVADHMTNYTDMKWQTASSSESDMEWIEPPMHLYNLKTPETQGLNKVVDAFRLLQTNPSIQRMVVSLSSDKAVWDAVMKNEVVQQFRESFYAVNNEPAQESDEDPDITTKILRWIIDNTKAKVTEFIDKITKLVNDLLHHSETEKHEDQFEDIVRSSLMLSVVVLIIVVVTRFHQADMMG
ncbi:hypothetical protein QJS04_geneDACA018449 [Acorus gramineus]|uniref:Uncharacterized protein n=1 Tax=Acorus gramineus TaxID=55184 RepID=A0AAV9AB27_ACOGR|nr:hypothetical protein QJS04_geneDACA018449 [Acorus gramineus]